MCGCFEQVTGFAVNWFCGQQFNSPLPIIFISAHYDIIIFAVSWFSAHLKNRLSPCRTHTIALLHILNLIEKYVPFRILFLWKQFSRNFCKQIKFPTCNIWQYIWFIHVAPFMAKWSLSRWNKVAPFFSHFIKKVSWEWHITMNCRNNGGNVRNVQKKKHKRDA